MFLCLPGLVLALLISLVTKMVANFLRAEIRELILVQKLVKGKGWICKYVCHLLFALAFFKLITRALFCMCGGGAAIIETQFIC